MTKKEEKYKNLRQEIADHYSKVYGGSSSDDVMVYLTEKLIQGTHNLNILTMALIGLTVILAILTGISVWKIF